MSIFVLIKAQELHNLTSLDVSVVVRDAKVLDTYFADEYTRERLNLNVLSNLFDCDLVVKKSDKESHCRLIGKTNLLKMVPGPQIKLIFDNS